MSFSWPIVFPVPKAREHHEHQLASPSCEFPVPKARQHHEHQLAGCFSSAQSTGASSASAGQPFLHASSAPSAGAS